MKPLIFKISGVWGNHEGSILLFTLILAINSAVFSIFYNGNKKIKNITSALLLFLISAFCSYVIFTSNPFQPNPIVAKNGLGLNPILQNYFLAIHPPILYIGYTMIAVVFALIIALIILQKFKTRDIIEIKRWTVISLIFLTIGITLGSVWAYSELGWGGFWFWDPVENASLIPWINLLILLHFFIIFIKSKKYLNSCIILSLISFPLVIMSIFLVRSGVLTSVHSFSSDPLRGLYILFLITLINGIGFLVYFIKYNKIQSFIQEKCLKKPQSKYTETTFIGSLFLIACQIIIISGTLFPIFAQIFFKEEISVGNGYFNLSLLPFLLCIMITMQLNLAQSKLNRHVRFHVINLIFSVLSGVLITYSAYRTNNLEFDALKSILLLLCLIATINSFAVNIQSWLDGLPLKRQYNIIQIKSFIMKTPIRKHAVFLAHTGFSLTIFAIIISSLFTISNNHIVNVTNSVKIKDYIITYDNVEYQATDNYLSRKMHFSIAKKNKTLYNLPVEKRLFLLGNQKLTTETAIALGWLKHIHIIPGSIANNGMMLRLIYKPFIPLALLGIIIIICSFSMIIFSKRKLIH